uniref:Uncharacterized protein n=1 Tax=Arundo donax TaxID=35708 RepID=A0A0A8Z859_ARUDO
MTSWRSRAAASCATPAGCSSSGIHGARSWRPSSATSSASSPRRRSAPCSEHRRRGTPAPRSSSSAGRTASGATATPPRCSTKCCAS